VVERVVRLEYDRLRAAHSLATPLGMIGAALTD